MEREIILEPANPLDLTPDELASVAAEISEARENIQVQVRYQEQRGAGVTLWDVLYVWLPDAELLRDATWGYIIGRLLELLASRRRRDKDSRPSSIRVLDRDGKLVKEIKIENGSVTEEDPEDEYEREMPPTTAGESTDDETDSAGSG